MKPPHTFTLTGNLLAERTLAFDRWQPGRTQRARGETFQVGGKGINVSKMLTRLHIPNTALCFTGGAPGAECEEWLRARGFAFRAFATDRPTRTGTVVRAEGQPETTFLGPDVAPSAAAVQACADHLDAQPDGGVLAVCGSLPGWSDARFDPLRAALERWLQRGALAVDTYGPPLRWFAGRPVALVKINATEFRDLTGAATPLAEALADPTTTQAARAWIVTDGPGAVWFVDPTTGQPPASLAPPVVTEVSATGSGDVLFAAVIEGLFYRKVSVRQAVADALPLAAANAAHLGVAEFPLAPDRWISPND